MKNLIYILGLIGVLGSTIISCTPEDKNLNRPTSFDAQGASAKNLRVGTLGQTIWAVQNIEQVGSAIRYCLDHEKPIEKIDSKTIKRCNVEFRSSSTDGKANLMEKWKVMLELSADGHVLYASGDLVRGYSTTVFKTINSYLQYAEKSFSYTQTLDQKIYISVESSGEIGSNVDNFKFVHNVSAEGLTAEQTWNLSNFKHELTLLNMGQTFVINSNNVVLNWSSLLCADYVGTATAIEQGKTPSIVVFDATIAKSDKPKWSQKLRKCGNEREERKMTSLNLEYLFY